MLMEDLNTLFCLLPLLLLSIQTTISDDNIQVAGSVGAVFDKNSRIGKEVKIAMEIALQDFHLHSNIKLVLHVKHSQADQPYKAALAAMDLINKEQVKAIIGQLTWEEMSMVAKLGSQNQVPILSLVDKMPRWATDHWPYLLQASASKDREMKAIAAIVKSWRWHQVTVIIEDMDASAKRSVELLFPSLKKVGAEISRVIVLPPFISIVSLDDELERLKREQCRVFVVDLSLTLATSLFERAKYKEMMQKGYVWITTHRITSLVHSINASLISSMEGVIGVKSYISEHGKMFHEFYKKFRTRFSVDHPEENNIEPGISAVEAYDVMRTVALAFNKRGKCSQDLLQNILQIDFHGLSGRIQFFDKNLHPANKYVIINVVGKSYRELALWNYKLGFSKTNDKNLTYDSSMKAIEPLWPGGTSQMPRGWTEPATNDKPLKIAVPVNRSFTDYVKVNRTSLQNKTVFFGLAIDIFKAVLDQLPFYLPYEFVEFNGTYNDVLDQIHLKKFDAVVGHVGVVAKRYDLVELTLPYSETGLAMVVPAQYETCVKPWLFLMPFTKSLWFVIIAMNIYNGLVVWLIERNDNPELKGPVVNQVVMILWLSFNTLFSLHGEKLHSNLSKMSMVVWLFVALVLTQTYTANLTSIVTVQGLVPSINDVGDLHNSNAMVGYTRGSFVDTYLRDVLGFPIENLKNYNELDDYEEAFRKKEIHAAFFQVSIASLFLAKYCRGFMRVGPTYKVGGFAFALSRGSPLLPSINEALLKVFENGRLQEMENSMIASIKCRNMETEDDNPSISPSSFWIPLVLTGGASTTALVIHIIRAGNSILESSSIWRIIMLVMKVLSYQRKRFDRRVISNAENTLTVSS